MTNKVLIDNSKKIEKAEYGEHTQYAVGAE